LSARAGIVVTGTEVLTGRVSDANGPWLAEQLRQAGVDIANVIVVGDRPDDLRGCLRYLIATGVDLIVTSGGLGPTADDLTAEIVAEVQGRPIQLDGELEAHIGSVVARLIARRGWHPDPEATAAATRKQALVPAGATVIPPVGTAPGLIVPPAGGDGPPVVVLPGPPRELQRMWPAVLADATVTQAIAGRVELRQETLRFWGTLESDFAATLRELGPALDGLEITTCLRDGGELEVVTRYEPAAKASYDAFAATVGAAYARTLLSRDGRTIDELVAERLITRRLTISTAESCTAGLLAGRLTDRAGSSAYVLGGLVVYSNRAKTELAGVPAELIERVGAVSAEVAEALATGVRERLHTDIGVGITGVAGPGGGTPAKPVGLVHLCVVGPDRTLPYVLNAPGGRAEVRSRAVAVALRLVYGLLVERTDATGEPQAAR
jgi:nicotinamide-nucleotide amidase